MFRADDRNYHVTMFILHLALAQLTPIFGKLCMPELDPCISVITTLYSKQNEDDQ